MNLLKAIERVECNLDGKQDPDEVNFHKQWDEYGGLKGWIVNCVWNGRNGEELSICFDMTQGYTRIVGNLDEAPDFIKGTHQMYEEVRQGD